MEKIIKISLSVLFLLCLADMPYGYFQFVRFCGMVGFGILAIKAKERGIEGLFYFYVASAVLINPFIKVSLGRDLWNILDVIWAIFLIASIYLFKHDELDTN